MPAIACPHRRDASRKFRAAAVCTGLVAAIVSLLPLWPQTALSNEWPASLKSPATLEAKLLADMADGRLDLFSLTAACLIAIGNEDAASIASAEAKVKAWQREVANQCQNESTSLAQAKRAFQFMHGKLLTGKYRAEQHDLRAAIESGDYNCLTATLLFRLISRDLDVHVVGMTAPGHVWIQAHFPRDSGESMQIESTSPEWTRPDIKSPGRTLSDVQLVAKIYYNRGAESLERKDFAAAVCYARTGLMLDPADQYSRMNLLAAMNNWAIALAGSNRHAEAAALLAEGMRHSPDYAPFAANQRYVCSAWARELAGEGRWREVLELPGRIAGL